MSKKFKFTILIFLALVVVVFAVVKKQDKVATIYVGNIITIDDNNPRAEAIAVSKKGEIFAVGDKESVLATKTSNTKVIDLEGKTLMPAFFDSHSHFSSVGLLASSANLLPPPDGGVATVNGVIKALKDWYSKNPDAKMIVGYGYDDSFLKEKRHIYKEDLDKVSTTLPVFAFHVSGHLVAVNSKALEMLNVNKDTKDPEGGTYDRYRNSSEPNGLMMEMAIYKPFMYVMENIDPEGKIIKAQEIYASFGYTTVEDGAAKNDDIEILKGMAKKNELYLDVIAYQLFNNVENESDYDAMSTTYKNNFRVGGLKLILDGSPQGKTAWLTEEYKVIPNHAHGDMHYKGIAFMEDEQLYSYVSKLYSKGKNFNIHVNGDAAIDQLIKAIERLKKEYGEKDVVITAVHSQTIRYDQIDKFKELGIFPSYFPAHTFYWGDFHVSSVLGGERASRISPLKTSLEKGVKFSIHHDAPVVMPRPFMSLYAAVNRLTRSGAVLGAHERISVEDGLKALTLWPAQQHKEGDRKGSLEAGKLADLIIISQDPLTTNKKDLDKIQVIETIKGGKTIYKLEQN